MKKQALTLILAATVLAANPVFAMDTRDAPEAHRGLPYLNRIGNRPQVEEPNAGPGLASIVRTVIDLNETINNKYCEIDERLGSPIRKLRTLHGELCTFYNELENRFNNRLVVAQSSRAYRVCAVGVEISTYYVVSDYTLRSWGVPPHVRFSLACCCAGTRYLWDNRDTLAEWFDTMEGQLGYMYGHGAFHH